MAANKKIRVDRTFSTDNDTEDKGQVSLVEKARQLNTARTINGVSFNGTANISFGTDSVSEGSTNLYFTNARARSALSGSTGISYNSSTGAISCTITQYADSNARAAVSAGTGISYNSTTGVISTSAIPNASLANSSVTVGTTAISLGSSATTITGLVSVTSTSFTGSLSGNATTATTATNLNGGSVQATSGTFSTTLGVTGLITSTGGISGGAASHTTGTFSGAVSTGALTVSGAITATGEITAYYSDVNLKKDIVEIANPIEKVMSLRGVTFRPNETALALGITDKEEVGVIAQEVEAVLPQLVTPSAFAGFKTVKYDKLTALLLEAVKAQQLQIDALRAEIAKLGGLAKTEL